MDPKYRRLRMHYIQTPEQLSEFLAENETARNLTGLVSFNGYAKDVASILKELFPDRFVEEDNLARLLVKSKIAESVYPFTVPEGEIIPPIDIILPELPENVRHRLGDLIYDVSIDYYGPRFNRDPRVTLEMLEEKSQVKNPFAAEVMIKVREYYEDIFDFSVPGIGRIKDKY